MLRNLRIINGPSSEVTEMIFRRISPELRNRIEKTSFNAIALLNESIPDIYYYADVAAKAAAVVTADVHGTCPQHITTLALFGDVEAVHTAVNAIINDESDASKNRNK